MKSDNSVLILLVVLSFGKVQSQELLDIGCLPAMRPMMINSRNAARAPWMAYLTQNGEYICGGSLITNRFVLTAAHCATSTENLMVRLGEYDTSTTEDGPTISLPVIKVLQRMGTDIALLKLSDIVSFTAHIKPICIPIISHYKKIALTRKQFSVTGWGQTSRFNDAPATILQEIPVQQLDPSRCGNPEGQLCFDNPTQFICGGDSGSPLLADIPFYGHTVAAQFGVLSYGHERCYDYARYVDVNTYISWIQTLIAINK